MEPKPYSFSIMSKIGFTMFNTETYMKPVKNPDIEPSETLFKILSINVIPIGNGQLKVLGI